MFVLFFCRRIHTVLVGRVIYYYLQRIIGRLLLSSADVNS